MARRKPDGNDAYIGNRIRQARLEKKMSQEKLGEALGVTFQQVQKYEKGANRFQMGRLKKLSELLDKPPLWFTGLDADAGGLIDPLMSEFIASREGNELAALFFKIDQRGRTIVLDLVSHLVNGVAQHGAE